MNIPYYDYRFFNTLYNYEWCSLICYHFSESAKKSLLRLWNNHFGHIEILENDNFLLDRIILYNNKWFETHNKRNNDILKMENKIINNVLIPILNTQYIENQNLKESDKIHHDQLMMTLSIIDEKINVKKITTIKKKEKKQKIISNKCIHNQLINMEKYIFNYNNENKKEIIEMYNLVPLMKKNKEKWEFLKDNWEILPTFENPLFKNLKKYDPIILFQLIKEYFKTQNYKIQFKNFLIEKYNKNSKQKLILN